MESLDLSLVIETSTPGLSGVSDGSERISAWCREVAALGGRSCEVILTGGFPVAQLPLPPSRVLLRSRGAPDQGYYEQKNDGANAALGRIVLFSDADCRPSAGYLSRLMSRFEDPAVAAVAGVTVYEGQSLLSRLNSAFSFGHLWAMPRGLDSLPLTHNLALRRSALEQDPFGPYRARIGGDQWLTRLLRAKHLTLVVDPTLLVFHEDLSSSLRGFVERHRRELLRGVEYGRMDPPFSWPFAIASALALRPMLRLKRTLQARRALRFGPRELLAAVVLAGLYVPIDAALVLALACDPLARRTWQLANFGAPIR